MHYTIFQPLDLFFIFLSLIQALEYTVNGVVHASLPTFTPDLVDNQIRRSAGAPVTSGGASEVVDNNGGTALGQEEGVFAAKTWKSHRVDCRVTRLQTSNAAVVQVHFTRSCHKEI